MRTGIMQPSLKLLARAPLNLPALTTPLKCDNTPSNQWCTAGCACPAESPATHCLASSRSSLPLSAIACATPRSVRGAS